MGGAGRSQSLGTHLRIMGREENQVTEREILSLAKGGILEFKKKLGEFRNLSMCVCVCVCVCVCWQAID